MREKSYKTPLGDTIYLNTNAIIIKFNGNRNVISTSLLNGGYREDIKYAYNYDGKEGSENRYELYELSYEEHLKLVAQNLGLTPRYATGLTTSADMRNASYTIESYKKLLACAIITAGVKGNAGRAGDPCSYDERTLKENFEGNGTINIILQINARMSPGALTRVLITLTEAKSVALQELEIGSKYSLGIATGTGTDGCIVIGDLDSKQILTNAGKHSKLGELIGKTVIKGVKKALEYQEGITLNTQRKRFGADKEI